MMKTRTKLPLVITCILQFSVAAHAAPAHVQSGYGECYPATSCSVDFGVPGKSGVSVAPGSLIVVTIRTDTTNGPVTSVTSQPGSQTCSLGERRNSVTGFWLEVWYCANARGGDTTVTVNVSGPADQLRVVLDEYSGVAQSSPVEDTPVSATGTSATANAGNITTTGDNRLIHAAAAADHNSDSDTFTPAAGYTIHDLGGSDPQGSDKTMTQHRVAATAGSYGTTMGNINDSWAAVAVAFASAGPPAIRPAAPTALTVQ
jgi:hypothetical protein